MKTFISRFCSNEDGATAIEYGLIAALLAVGISAALTNLKTEVVRLFTNVGTTLTTANK